MRPLLVLRPEPGASATAGRAGELGLHAIAVPLFEIEPRAWRSPDAGSFDGLLLTSANAVRHGGDQLQALRSLPVYAVGEATARAAVNAGFDVGVTGNGGIDRLLESFEADVRLLHLCGEDRHEPTGRRQRVTCIPVYRAKEVHRPDLSAAPGSVALIHSPRAGRRFAELVHSRESVGIAAISRSAADAVGGGWDAVEVAETQTDDALLALAVRLCNISELK